MTGAKSNVAADEAAVLASLLSGAPLRFVSPFEASAFLAHLDATGRVRLVAPRRILPALDDAGLLTNGALLSCIAIARPEDEDIEFRASPLDLPDHRDRERWRSAHRRRTAARRSRRVI